MVHSVGDSGHTADHNLWEAAMLSKADLNTPGGTVLRSQLGTGPAVSGKYLDGTGAWIDLPTPPSSGSAWRAALDSFTGADDTTKLTNAISYAGAQTYIPVIGLDNRKVLFTQSIQTFDGLKIMGPPGYSNAEKSNANNGCQVEINIPGGTPWLDAHVASGSNRFDVTLEKLSFLGHSGQQLIGNTIAGTGSFYCCLFRDISATSFKHIIGNTTANTKFTGSVFDGFWDIANSYNTAFRISGSDNTFWPSGMYLDSGTAFNSSPGLFHVWFDFCEKTFVGPIYVTCDSVWSGIKVDGPAYNAGVAGNNGGPLILNGLRLEGRNTSTPCNGALLRVQGGIVILRDSWTSYGMKAPGTTHSPADAGVIHATGGSLMVTGCTYDRASTIDEAVTYVYAASGAKVRVKDITVGTKGGTWTGLPRTTFTGTGTTLVGDDTVTAV